MAISPTAKVLYTYLRPLDFLQNRWENFRENYEDGTSGVVKIHQPPPKIPAGCSNPIRIWVFETECYLTSI
jgi:hypothetical protein